MRNVLLTMLSLAVFTVASSQIATAFGQESTCDLRLKIVEKNTADIDELKPIKGASAVAIRDGNSNMVLGLTRDGQLQIQKLTEGEYRISVTKKGFKRTVLPIELICAVPDHYALINVELQRGSSALTVVNKKLTLKAGLAIEGATVVLAGPEHPPSAIDEATSSSRSVVYGGVLNGKAIKLPKPAYPAIARTAGASGKVTVQLLVDEEGNVIAANAVSGHPLLRSAAVQAARAAKFAPTTFDGKPMRVSGVIIYDFVFTPEQPREPKAVTD